MKNWTIKSQIMALGGFLLAMIAILSIVQIAASSQVNSKYEEVSDVHLPAVRLMTLTDMMHDGIRAVVYKALFLSHSEMSQQDKSELADELKEFTDNIKNYLAQIEKLNVHADTREAIAKSKSDLDVYIQQSESVVAMVLTGKATEAQEQLKEFNKSFEALEEKLGALGELIEVDSEETRAEAKSLSAYYSKLDLVIVIGGFFLGLFITWFIIRSLLQRLKNVIHELNSTSAQLSQSSNSTASTATELSESTTEQAASLQETMASIEEISAMVAQNAESAEKVLKSVNDNKKVTAEGTASVTEMLGAIEDIKKTNDQILQQMESSNKEFSNIVQIISNIGEKTKVINDIVFQTKLLSFNASVEAARAGEHGKGFAVVAEEVGNLAQMSGNAAKEITGMLSESIKKVNEIVDISKTKMEQLVEVGRDKVAMGQSTAQKCKESLNKIAESATSVSTMVNEITHASKEQSQGVQEINKAISQLDQVTQQNSAVAQQSSNQAEALRQQSILLQKALQSLVEMVDKNLRSPSEPSISAEVSIEKENNLEVINFKKPSTTEAIKKAAGSDVNDVPKFEEF